MNYHQTDVIIYLCFSSQDELYDHLDELEVTRVDKQVKDAMVWMSSKMNQQNNQDLTLDPVVNIGEIHAKIKVLKECIQRHVQIYDHRNTGGCYHSFIKSTPVRCNYWGKKWVNHQLSNWLYTISLFGLKPDRVNHGLCKINKLYFYLSSNKYCLLPCSGALFSLQPRAVQTQAQGGASQRGEDRERAGQWAGGNRGAMQLRQSQTCRHGGGNTREKATWNGHWITCFTSSPATCPWCCPSSEIVINDTENTQSCIPYQYYSSVSHPGMSFLFLFFDEYKNIT